MSGKKILSIDGGGSRGVIALTFLQEIEKRTGKQIHELFDLIAGSSTGGIIASCLTIPDENVPTKAKYSAEEVIDVYREFGPNITKFDFFHSVKTLFGLIGPKYSAKQIKEETDKIYGKTRLRDLLTPVLFTTYNLNTTEPYMIVSTNKECRGLLLSDAVLATSAAPTFFPPHEIEISGNKGLYIDGALAATNPAVYALIEEGFVPPAPKQFIVSVGTGAYGPRPGYFKGSKNWGILQWLTAVFSVFSDGTTDAATSQAQRICDNFFGDFYRLDVNIPEEYLKIDDTDKEYMDYLIKRAKDYIEQNTEKFDELCEKLVS